LRDNVLNFDGAAICDDSKDDVLSEAIEGSEETTCHNRPLLYLNLDDFLGITIYLLENIANHQKLI